MAIDPFRPARIALGFYQALHDYSAAETREACADAWRRLDHSRVDGGGSRELLALRTPFVAAAVDAGVPYPEADAAYGELIAAARHLQQTAGEIPVVHTPHGKAALRAVVEKDAPGWPL